jgi:hypothetical protein
MSESQKLKSPARRSFFKKAGLGLGAAGAAAVGLSGNASEAALPKAPNDHTASSYRETDHVKKAYETSRF